VERHAYEMNLLPVVEKFQLGVIPYLLAAGFLTGKYSSQQEREKAKRGAFVQHNLYSHTRGLSPGSS